MDHLGDLFKVMFPDNKMAARFSLNHTSASYVISEGIAPYFTRIIMKDLLKSLLPFALHFETTAQVKNQMDLTLRHWSPTHIEV